jgi:hypothetical protein
MTVLRPPLRAKEADMAYDYGFYDADGTIDGASFRWAAKDAVAVLPTGNNWMRLTVWVNHMDIATNPVDVHVRVDRRVVIEAHLTSAEPITRYVKVPAGNIVLATSVSRVVHPMDFGVHDSRDLGLLVSWRFFDVLPPGATLVQ